MKRIGIIFLGFLIAVSVLMVGCGEDVENPGNPPELPPKASLTANLGNFPQNEDGRVDETNAKGNFLFAAVNVGFWQTLVGAAIVIPAAAFEAAFDESFEYVASERKWKSSYTVGTSGSLISAELYAENKGETVGWEMYLSQEGQFDRFLWFTGESRVDNTGGEWILYTTPADPKEVLHIDWDRNGADFINSKYVMVDSESSKEGSFIEYGLSTEADFTHYYEVSVVDTEGDDYDAFILFNETTTEGRIKSEAYFGDSDFRCWDDGLEDIDC
ncbi:MAG: hypothetical protein RJQ14_04590 [Marinoscillum sp.]